MRLHKFKRNPNRVFTDFRYFLVREITSSVLAPPFFFAAKGLARLASRNREKLIEQHKFPKISVVVAVRNSQQQIKKAISSLQCQSYRNIEIIVVDDFSDDASFDIVKRLASDDRRIVQFKVDRHRGAAYCRNVGLSQASGDYVTFQDSDDYSHAERLEIQMSVLLRRPMSVVSLCRYNRVNEAGGKLKINGETERKCIISMMFPRQKVLNDVGFFRHLKVSEDADYYERIKCRYGKHCEVVVNQTLYQALFRPDSLLMSKSQKLRVEGAQVFYQRDSETNCHWQALLRDHEDMAKGLKSVYAGFFNDNLMVS